MRPFDHAWTFLKAYNYDTEEFDHDKSLGRALRQAGNYYPDDVAQTIQHKNFDSYNTEDAGMSAIDRVDRDAENAARQKIMREMGIAGPQQVGAGLLHQPGYQHYAPEDPNERYQYAVNQDPQNSSRTRSPITEQ